MKMTGKGVVGFGWMFDGYVHVTGTHFGLVCMSFDLDEFMCLMDSL